MILASADLSQVYARLAVKFNAPIVEQVQHRIRTPEETVQVRHGAPAKEDDA
jgi:hypothetical protein